MISLFEFTYSALHNITQTYQKISTKSLLNPINSYNCQSRKLANKKDSIKLNLDPIN